MRAIGLLPVFLVVAGCSHGAPPPGPSSDPYLVDPQDPTFDGPYDILETYVQELNGSFVVTVYFRNFRAADGNFTLPKVEARVEVEREGRRTWFYAGNKPDLTRAAPHVAYVMGRWDDGAHEELAEICAEHTANAHEPPFMIRMEYPNENTTLAQGEGTIRAIHVESGDFDGNRYDTAERKQAIALRGGPNPHDTCPLVAERPR